MTARLMTKVKFVSTISKMGDKRVIVVPKDYHKDVENLTRQVKITIDDEI
jgi:hypothetical protein